MENTNINAHQNSEDFQHFCNRYKKGSSIFKNHFKGISKEYVPHNIIKYSENTDTVIEVEKSCALNKLWTLNILGNETKTFIFKLHNNSLGYNTIVSKFVRGHSSLCTFCSISRNPDDERESPLHLFYHCRHVEPIIEFIFRIILGPEAARMTRSDFFGGFKYENQAKNDSLLIVNTLIKKFIWTCRNGKFLPTIDTAQSFVTNNLRFFIDTSKHFRYTWQNSGINIAL